jgi:hypothetical protein
VIGCGTRLVAMLDEDKAMTGTTGAAAKLLDHDTQGLSQALARLLLYAHLSTAKGKCEHGDIPIIHLAVFPLPVMFGRHT